MLNAESMICRLAGMCDGAHQLDGHGFNKMDSVIGKSLAERAIRGQPWSQKQAKVALSLIAKYRRQIGGEAVIRTWMERPVFAMMPLTDAERKQKAVGLRKITSEEKTAVFTFPYDAGLVAALKGIRGEHKGQKYWSSWDGARKRWTVPVNESSIQNIMTLAREWEFEIEERFETYYSRVMEKLDSVQGAAEESRVVTTLGYKEGMSVENGMISITHRDASVLAEFQEALSKL